MTRKAASDKQFEADLLQWLGVRSLLLLDRGFYHFQFFADLITKQVDLVTRLKARTVYSVERVLSQTDQIKDQLILLGTGHKGTPQLQLRLVQVRLGPTWYSYLTSVRDLKVLPPFVVADLYRRRSAD